MRVLLLPHRFPPFGRGGVETWATHLRAGLVAAGAQVGILTRDDRDDAPLPPLSVREEHDELGPIYWIRHRHRDERTFRDSWADPRMEAAVLHAIRAFGPDVLHVGHADGFGVAPFRLGRRFGVPVVCTLHDPKWLCVRGQMVRPDGTRCDAVREEACTRCVADQLSAGPLRGLARRLGPTRWKDLPIPAPTVAGAVGARRWRVRQAALRGALLGAAEVISPSRFLAERVQHLGLTRAVRVIGNGLPVAAPRPLPPGPLRVGWFGSDVPAKGLDTLLAAMASVPGATLEIHGRVTRASLPPNVTLRGSYDPAEVHGRMTGVHVVCVPSSWDENQPYVVLEARRAGRPVLASRVGGLPELVRDDVDGWLVEPGRIESWAGALRALLDLERVRAAATHVRPPPTEHTLARAHLSIYAEHLAEPAMRFDAGAVPLPQ